MSTEVQAPDNGNPAETSQTAKPQARRGLFAKFKEVDEVTGKSFDINNLEIQLGSNKMRVLTAPILVLKHWDLPESAELKSVPCAKFVEDLDKYAEDPEAYLASLPPCPYCEIAAKYPGFYTLKQHWVFNVVQDGVIKIAEFFQRSVLNALNSFECDEDWQKLMPRGLIDLEINIKKEQTGPKAQNVKYSVGGIPGSGPLDPAQEAKYLSEMPDLVTLKRPPSMEDADGKAKWDEYLSKNKAPKTETKDGVETVVEKVKAIGS